MQYLLETIVYSTLFYGVYLLALKNKASHDWSRAYLLLCAALPPVIPIIKIPAFYTAAFSAPPDLNISLPEIAVFNKPLAATSAFNWFTISLAAYFLITLVLLARALFQFLELRRFLTRQECELRNGVRVLLNTGKGPGSFMDYVFLPGAEIEPAIFEHELAHIRLNHSRDVFFLRILQSFFWPNILLHFIMKELKVVHEFQADADAATNEASYINTLLNDIFSTGRFSLSHTFFYHPVKRRIMMLRSKSVSRPKLRRAKWAAVSSSALLLAVFVYFQSCKHPDSTDALSLRQKTASDSGTGADGNVYKKADIMPKSGYDLGEYLRNHLKYPDAAREKGIEGRVMVKFVIDADGNVVHPSIMKSPDTLLSEEALRVMKEMPRWTPGEQNGKKVAVYYYLPMMFMLGDNNSKIRSGLTAQENDTLMKLIDKSKDGNYVQTQEERDNMIRLMNKMKHF